MVNTSFLLSHMKNNTILRYATWKNNYFEMLTKHKNCDGKLNLTCLSFPRRNNHEIIENGD